MKYPPNLEYLLNNQKSEFKPWCVYNNNPKDFHNHKDPIYFIITIDFYMIKSKTYDCVNSCYLICEDCLKSFKFDLDKLLESRHSSIIEQDYIKNFNNQNIIQKINKALLLL